MTSTDPLQDSPFTAEDVAVAVRLLTRELSEPVTELITLTDEELLAVEGLQKEQITPLPWASANISDGAPKEAATATAMRSLMARGLVTTEAALDPRAFEQDPQRSNRFVSVPELQGTSVARRTADAVVITERITDRGSARSYFYVFRLDEGVRVLWEVFDDMGFHLFFLMEGDTFPEQLLGFADPEGVIGDQDGDPVEVPGADFELSETGQRLAQSRAATSVLVLEREGADPMAMSLFALPDHVELMESVEADGAELRRVGLVAKTTLMQFLQGIVAGPEAA